jgi:hypothetical protein
MTDELMQQLKDAGFKQSGEGSHKFDVNDENIFCFMDDGIVQYKDKSWGKLEAIYFPTLSELIAACGDEFVSLVQYSPGWWRANGNSPLYDEGTNWVDGARAPEEAVAKLWLTLNKK